MIKPTLGRIVLYTFKHGDKLVRCPAIISGVGNDGAPYAVNLTAFFDFVTYSGSSFGFPTAVPFHEGEELKENTWNWPSRSPEFAPPAPIAAEEKVLPAAPVRKNMPRPKISKSPKRKK